MKISQVSNLQASNSKQSQAFGAYLVMHGNDAETIMKSVEKHVPTAGIGRGQVRDIVWTVDDYSFMHSLRTDGQKDKFLAHLAGTAPVVSLNDVIGKTGDAIVELVATTKAKFKAFITKHNADTRVEIAKFQASIIDEV